MNLSEEQKIEKNPKLCGNCMQKTLLPYEFDWTCISIGYSVIKRKLELSKIQPKKK